MNKAKIILILLIFIFLIISYYPGNIQATGIGFILGSPTGLSLKFGNFPILGIGMPFGGGLHIHVDYWIKNPPIEGPFSWYFGMGGKLIIASGDKFDKFEKRTSEANKFGIGLRVPFGLQVFIDKQFEIFLEGAPGIIFFVSGPEIDGFIDFSLGFRYHF